MNSPLWPDLLLLNLRWGRDDARTLGELSEAMGAPRRALERAVEELRKSGNPIVTGSDGVWLTNSPDELRAAYRSLRARYVRQAVNARALLATARRYERAQQLLLFKEVA